MINQSAYLDCSHVPFLTPGNDSRVNLSLMLVDQRHATLQIQPHKDGGSEFGYSIVPFTMAALNADVDAALPAESKPESSGKTGQPGAGSAEGAPGNQADGAAANADANSADSNDSYATGEGSRCTSNEDGAGAFIDALKASSDVPEAERKALVDARQTMPAACEQSSSPTYLPPADVQSPAGKQFRTYLIGAGSFYAGDFATALASFNSLVDSTQPWLKETARYMVGRTQLNSALHGALDQWGAMDLNKVDLNAVAAAKAGLTGYLAQYPTGLYAASARGLMRRVYWLQGDADAMAQEYRWQFTHPDSPQHASVPTTDLIGEADRKLISPEIAPNGQVKDPELLAVMDLRAMRDIDPAKQISLSQLQSQQQYFAGAPDLYTYLLAAHALYMRGDADTVLKLLPAMKADHPLNYMEFSQQVLRGLAFESKQDWASASALWLSLLPVAKQSLQNATLQLALAIDYERSNKLAQVYAADSPITDASIRAILLRNAAGRDQLLERINAKTTPKAEHDLALFVLLYKDLMRGRYADFLTDSALLPADLPKPPADQPNASTSAFAYGPDHPLGLFRWTGTAAKPGAYACPALHDIAQTLARDPKAPQALNCLGDFVRVNDLDMMPLDTAPRTMSYEKSPLKPVILGSMPSQFNGTVFSRLEGYKSVIAAPGSDDDARAYALFRAVNCYGPSAYNRCGGKEVEIATRKAWFTTLKSRYAGTVWAREQKYYW